MDAVFDSSCCVLIVTSAGDESDRLATLIQQYGYYARIHPPSRDLLQQADRPPPLAILLMAFGCNEAEAFCQHLVAAPALAGVPVICLAEASDPRSACDYFAAGAADYLRAPWSDRELLARLAAHSRLARQCQELRAENDRLRHGRPAAPADALTLEALRNSEARYRALVEALPDLLIRMDREGVYLDVIPGRNQSTLQPASDKVGVNVCQVLPFAAAQQQIAAARAALASDEVQDFEQRLDFNGRVCYEAVTVVPCHANEVLLVVRDITARKQAEAALRASEATNRAMLRAIPDLLICIGRDGRRRALFASKQMPLLGAADRHIGEPISNQLPPELAARRLAAVGAAITTNELQTYEYAIEIDGETRYEEARVVPINAEEALVMVRDMTERQRAAAELRAAKEAAEVASRAKSQFLANMSHELRTPLNAILGFAQLLAESENLTPDQQQNVAIVLRSGKHLLHLINDILDWANLETHRVSLHCEIFDLYNLLNDVRALFQVQAQQQDASLELQLATDLPRHVRSDRRKLHQVLVNLLSNAMERTKDGQVAIAVEPKTERATSGQPTRLRFCLSDTGSTLAADSLHLLQPSIDLETKASYADSTGLSMAISRHYVQLLGGELQVLRQPGGGNQFQFEVAVDLAAADSRHPTAPELLLAKPARPLTPDHLAGALAATEVAWRTAAVAAVLSLDSQAIEAAIAQLPAHQADLAQQLRQYADDFRYDTLLELLQTEEVSTQETVWRSGDPTGLR